MSLISDLKNAAQLTERESDIRDHLLSHPEHIAGMSCQDLGKATYTSAATVTRFCKKFGCKGYPDFKVRFLSDVKGGQILGDPSSVQLSERENMVTLLQKVSEVQTRALEATRETLSLSQLLRIQKLLLDHPYLGFYAYDTNIHLARLLRRNGTKRIIITSSKETTLGKMADECLYAPRPATVGEVETDKLSIPTFFTATKYLLSERSGAHTRTCWSFCSERIPRPQLSFVFPQEAGN